MAIIHSFDALTLLSEPVMPTGITAVDILVPNDGETRLIKQIRIANVFGSKVNAKLYFCLAATAYAVGNSIGWNIPITANGRPYSERVWMPIKSTHKLGFQSSEPSGLVISLWGDIITGL